MKSTCCKEKIVSIYLTERNASISTLKKILKPLNYSDIQIEIIMDRVEMKGSCLLLETNDQNEFLELSKKLVQNNISFRV